MNGQKVQRFRSSFTSGWFEFSLRFIGVLALVGACLGPYRQHIAEHGQLLMLLDISDSMDEGVGSELLERAQKLTTGVDRVDIVPFAERPSSVSFRSTDGKSFRAIRDSWSSLNIGVTDLGAALMKGASEGAGAVVLLSDGQATTGDSESALSVFSSAGLKVFPLTVGDVHPAAGTVRISQLHAPLLAPAEKSVEVRSVINNSTGAAQRGTLQIKHGDKIIFEQAVTVPANAEALFLAQSDPSKQGIQAVTAHFVPEDSQLAPSADTIYISGATREKVLLINGTSEDGVLLEKVLQNKSYQLTTINDPRQTPLPDLTEFSVVLLNNVAVTQLSSGAPSALEAYARKGGGLAMIGGNKSFGLGGYIGTPIETAMPVKFVPPQTVQKRLNVAIELVLDKSGSMRENQKIEYAQEAARAVIQSLKNDDYVGVIGFDANPFVVVRLAQLSENRESALTGIGRLFPAGRTNPLPALDEARRALVRAEAGRKHVVMLTDGKIPEAGSFYVDTVAEMKRNGITVSTVMLGDETDTAELRAIADAGGGAFYQTSDPSSLPHLFLSDVKVSSGEQTLKENKDYIVRRAPTQIRTTQIDAFPPLKGYVETQPKPDGNLELVVVQDAKAEPLLASWKFGAGKTKAFTSDANGRWSSYWASWSKFQNFWSDFVDDLKPAEGEKFDETKFDLRYGVERGTLNLDLTIFSEDSEGTVTADVTLPNNQTVPLSFSAVARGRYTAALDQATAGKYILKTKVSGKKLTPVAFNLSGELFGERKGAGFNGPVLSRIASRTGGVLNPKPEQLQSIKRTEITEDDLSRLWIAVGLCALLLEILVRELGVVLFNFRRARRTWVAAGVSVPVDR